MEKVSMAHARIFLGGPSVASGTTYGAVDGPAGPSVAAILGLGGSSTSAKTCCRWSRGTDFGRTIHGMKIL